MYSTTFMEKLKSVSGAVRGSIDLNKQEQSSQGFTADCVLLKPVWRGCSCRYFLSHSLSITSSLSLCYKSHFLVFPTFFFLLCCPSEGLSPRGREGVIWSLWALIKTSVWLSGISCADVCVSVYFSVALWLHDNLPFPSISFLHRLLFLLSSSHSLCFCFSQGIDEASSKDKWVFWPHFLLLGRLLLFMVDWQTVTVAVELQSPLLVLYSQMRTDRTSSHRHAHTHIYTQTHTHRAVTYCSVYLVAAALRRPWTPRMRWMSFLDGPLTRAALTSCGKITSRSFCSLFRHLTSRKRLVSDPRLFAIHQNSLSRQQNWKVLLDILFSVLQKGWWSLRRIRGLHTPCFLLHLFHSDHHFPEVSSSPPRSFAFPGFPVNCGLEMCSWFVYEELMRTIHPNELVFSLFRRTTLMLGLYISIFVILTNILFICAIYSCIKVRNKGLHHSYDSSSDKSHYHMSSARTINGINSFLSDLVPAACIQALPGCLADCNQENSPVTCKQHTGWRLHHPPPLHLLFC